jgi:hypothetical protein
MWIFSLFKRKICYSLGLHRSCLVKLKQFFYGEYEDTFEYLITYEGTQKKMREVESKIILYV